MKSKSSAQSRNKKLLQLSVVLALFLLCFPACSDNRAPTDIKSLIDYSIDNVIFVQGGSFMMGEGYPVVIDGKEIVSDNWTGNSNNKPLHKVTLDSYYLSRYELTFSEYDIYSQSNGLELLDQNFYTPEQAQARINRMKVTETTVPVRGPLYPVALQSWYHAKAYCQWIGELTGLPFDLPSEAQWEYAARSGGKNVLFATNNGQLNIGQNFKKRKFDEVFIHVGSHPPNPLGFYDMSGNAGEWVNDWYDDEYYKSSPSVNPNGPLKSPFYRPKKTWRGGSNLGVERNVMVTVRYGSEANKRDSWVGTRCALQLKEKLSSREIKKRIKWKNVKPKIPVLPKDRN